MSPWQRLLWRWLAGAFATLVILLAALAGAFRLAAPHVPGYRAQLEQWASAALQRPVSIRSMGAEWGWYGPEIALEEVRIHTADGAGVAVAAREVRLGLSLWALLHGQLPRPNRIVLVAPQLEIERDADGVYSIVGLEGATRKTPTDWHQTLRDTFAQPAEIVVKNGQLTFMDARYPGAAVFQRINLSIDNQSAKHDIQASMLLPAAYGRSLRFELHIAGEGIDPHEWDWHGRVRGTALMLPRWLSYWPDYDGRFTDGVLDLDAQAIGQVGALQQVAVDVQARNLLPAAQAFPTSAAGGFGLLQGRVDWTREKDGWRLSGEHLQMQRGTATWPNGSFDLDYSHGVQDQWSGEVGFLRLQDLDVLVGWLQPELATGSQRLLSFGPAGDISEASFKFQTDGKTLGDWAVKGRFQDLGLYAAEGWPGFSGFDGVLDLDQQGGKVMLNTRDASVDFTPLFRTPLHADTLDLGAKVTHDASGWRIASDGFNVTNTDATAHGHGAMQFPADGSAPVLDLDATVDHADAHNKSTYFPVGIMPKDVVKWLDDSIKGGEVTSGSVSIHGKTSDFPFRDGHGVFDIQFHMLHGELDYAPGWPALKDLDADVRFLDQGLEAHAHGGSIQGDAIGDSLARFADLNTGVLEVQGTAKGSAANGLDFLRAGPLRSRFGHALDDLQAKGDTDVSLQLTLPVTELDKFQLKGRATLHAVSIGPKSLPAFTASQLAGDVDFTGEGFSSQGLTGSFLGGPLALVIHPQPGAPDITQFSAHGSVHADNLASAVHAGSSSTIGGSTNWRLDGKVPNNPAAGTAGLSLNLRSDMQGLAVNLPAPFGKPAEQVLPLRFSFKLMDQGRLDVDGGYGDVAQLRMDLSSGDAGLQVDHGELHLGAGTATLPDSAGLLVDGELTQFVWDDWKPILEPSTTQAASAAAESDGLTHLPLGLQAVDLDIGHLAAFGQSFDDLHIGLSPGDAGWQAELDSEHLAGSIRIPARISTDDPLVFDMQRVMLSKPAPAAPVAPGTEAKAPAFHFDPRRIPAMRFSSVQLQYGEMAMENVSLALMPQTDGVALQGLKVSAPTFSLDGSGSWSVLPAGTQQTQLDADVESKDVEKTLQALGYDSGITGDKGSITTKLIWQDSPFGDVVDTLSGNLHIKLQDGQLKEVQPGAGRVFGLLSLNALPRRLLLNFSDVFAKGFGYDSIEGDFTLQDGDAWTKDLQMQGPAARITLIGRTGLAKHDFDEALVVEASVGSTLPVLGALAGGVGVGAVVWLLTEIFKRPLAAAGEEQYHLSGSWDNPVLTKLGGKTVPAAASKTRPAGAL